MDARDKVIAIRNLRKSYAMGGQQLEVLKGIDFHVARGEFVAILGPSGSGKSTLMNIIGLIDTKTSGEYDLDGISVEKFSEDDLAGLRNLKIGFIFQKFNLLGRFTSQHNVEIPLILRGKTKEEAREKSVDMLEAVGLKDRIHHKPIELSGGQQQRVAIARALVGEPQLILADEPTGNLDTQSGEEIMDILSALNREGNTIVLITHEPEIARRAHRIVQLKDGLVV
ncbi:MAG: macrolide ABC transporter ATP-binding protein [delta proteobacterium ML8_F1]|nr:MAG: macrolide ABC transporter ATP-binding protein [delta proteobacterium ML8_F1]